MRALFKKDYLKVVKIVFDHPGIWFYELDKLAKIKNLRRIVDDLTKNGILIKKYPKKNRCEIYPICTDTIILIGLLKRNFNERIFD